EQVMAAASKLAGYSLAQADLLRRAMGKKDKEKMAKERKNFIEGCARTNKIPEKKANAIFDLLEKFAGYGFNKSHSAAYGVISYQTAYLKAHYPVEFVTGLPPSNTSAKWPWKRRFANANKVISPHWRISARGWTRALPIARCLKALSRPAHLISWAETVPNFLTVLMTR